MTTKNWKNSLNKEEVQEAEIVDEEDRWYLDLDSEEDIASQDRKEKLDIEFREKREPSNQCCGDSRNMGLIHSDTFFHRHPSEPLITRALKNSDALFAPMSVWMRGKSGTKIEPDFMVMAHQQCGVMEINGRSHDQELANTRQKRIQCFKDQLVFVQDYPLPQDYDLDWAYRVVEDFLKRLRDRKIFMAGRNGGDDYVE